MSWGVPQDALAGSVGVEQLPDVLHASAESGRGLPVRHVVVEGNRRPPSSARTKDGITHGRRQRRTLGRDELAEVEQRFRDTRKPCDIAYPTLLASQCFNDARTSPSLEPPHESAEVDRGAR